MFYIRTLRIVYLLARPLKPCSKVIGMMTLVGTREEAEYIALSCQCGLISCADIELSEVSRNSRTRFCAQI
jgi:hypothetical protein